MDLGLAVSICYIQLSAIEGVVLDLATLPWCFRSILWTSLGLGVSVPLSRRSTFTRTVVIAGNGTTVIPAVSLEQQSWFCHGHELRSGTSLGSS